MARISRPWLLLALACWLTVGATACMDIRLTVDARDADSPAVRIDVSSEPLFLLLWETYLGQDPWRALGEALAAQGYAVTSSNEERSTLVAERSLASLAELPGAIDGLLASAAPLWVLPDDDGAGPVPRLEPVAAPLTVEQTPLIRLYRVDWPVLLPAPLPENVPLDLVGDLSVTLDLLLEQPPHAANAHEAFDGGRRLRWQLKPGRVQRIQLELRRFQPHPVAVLLPAVLVLAGLTAVYAARRPAP